MSQTFTDAWHFHLKVGNLTNLKAYLKIMKKEKKKKLLSHKNQDIHKEMSQNAEYL